VRTFMGAKRLECVELAPAFDVAMFSDSASELDALQTIRATAMPILPYVGVLGSHTVRGRDGARLSPAAAHPGGSGARNVRAALRFRCCCGWGQPRSGGRAEIQPRSTGKQKQGGNCHPNWVRRHVVA